MEVGRPRICYSWPIFADCAELDESLSGSESSGSDSDNSAEDERLAPRDGDLLHSLLKRQASMTEHLSETSSNLKRKRGSGRPPLVWFTSSALPANTSFGIWRAVFTNEEQKDDSQLMASLRKKQLTPIGPLKNPDDGGVALPKFDTRPQIFLCMIGGGHFAAMVVSLAPKLGKKPSGDERQASVVAHKTFHRYTTRRKQGGAQSANDAGKGAAHSAGSSLRRYNETALVDDVRMLLKEWKSMIDASELLFIRATGATNRRTLFGPYEEQILRYDDPRTRGFPFSTRRATQAELMRCFVELTRAKLGNLDRLNEAAQAAEDAEAKALAEFEALKVKSVTPKSPEVPKRSPEEEEALLHTSQIEALIRRNKAPALVSYFSSNHLAPSFRFYPPDTQAHHHCPTPLHLASSSNAPALVSALLLKAGADPSIRSVQDRTAFEVAGDRATREAFRVARSELGENVWNWSEEGRVPEPLTRTEVVARARQEKLEEETREAGRRKQGLESLRDKEQKKEEERRRRVDDKREQKMGKGKTLMSSTREKTAEERRQEEARGMTPETKARMERERRARAAEERMRRTQPVSSTTR